MTTTARRVGTVVGPQGIPGRNGGVGAPGPPGTPGASGTSATLPSFTVPAVGSPVGPLAPLSGISALIKGCGINVAGAGSYTVTANTGTLITIVNNLSAADGNAAPGTVITSGKVATVQSSVAPFGAVPPGEGQTHILLNGVWTPTGVLNCYTAAKFGAVGDGSVDDQPALQAAVADMLTHGGILFLPGTQYKLGNTLVIDGLGGRQFHLMGVYGLGYPPGTLITWAGPNGVPMLQIQNLYGFGMTDIGVNGGGTPGTATGPSSCINLHGTASAATYTALFERVQASNPWSANYWIPGHTYSTGDFVVGPDGNQGFISNHGIITCNGHLYRCTTGGLSHATGPGSIWGTTAGATVSDNVAQWVEIGPVGSGWYVGDPYNPAGYQVSEISLKHCFSSGDNLATSGYRQVIGGNVKNAEFVHCEWQNHGRAIDLANAAGSFKIDHNIFQGSVETDMFHTGAGTLFCTSCASEASRRVLVSLGQSCQDSIIGFTWEGNPDNFPGGNNFPNGIKPSIITQNQLYLQGNDFFASVNGGGNLPFQIVADHLDSSGTYGGGIISVGNIYEITPFFSVYDTAGNLMVPPGSVPQHYLAGSLRISSKGDQGTLGVTGGPVIPFIDYNGQEFQLSSQQISQASSVGEVPNANVDLFGTTIVGGVMRMTVRYQLLTAAAGSQTFTIACPFNKCLITNVVVDVRTGFATINTPTIKVGKVIGFSGLNVNGGPTGGTATADAYVTAASIATATGATPLGKNSGNQGAALTFPGDMVWGDKYNGSSATQWALTITITAGSGNVNVATAGSLDLYVHLANYPAIH